jgi:RNA polymerase sigma factor (sigma-70 family)
MSEVTRILAQIEQGDARAAEQLLPLVYDELRKLAAAKLAREKPGQTLQATALVHEAYLRLVGEPGARDQEPGARENFLPAPGPRPLAPSFHSRGHFFAAAAEAMRRILVDVARAKQAEKRGGGWVKQPLDIAKIKTPEPNEELLALDEALERLAARDQAAARLVKLRFFAGMTAEQAADALGIAPRSADRLWSYARAFLLKELAGERTAQSGA